MVTEESWFKRNWKWLVPGGCLGTLLLCVVCVGGIFLLVTTTIKSSEVYQQALEKARGNAEVVAAFGEPIEEGWLPSGSIQISGPSGTAELEIPISGPKNSGSIYLVARKSAGIWEFIKLEVAVDGQSERIDLRQDAESSIDSSASQFPVKGDLNAPVVITEYSDYG